MHHGNIDNDILGCGLAIFDVHRHTGGWIFKKLTSYFICFFCYLLSCLFACFPCHWKIFQQLAIFVRLLVPSFIYHSPLVRHSIPFAGWALQERSKANARSRAQITSRTQIASWASWHLFLLCFLVPTGMWELLKLCRSASMWVCPWTFVHMLYKGPSGDVVRK